MHEFLCELFVFTLCCLPVTKQVYKEFTGLAGMQLVQWNKIQAGRICNTLYSNEYNAVCTEFECFF